MRTVWSTADESSKYRPPLKKHTQTHTHTLQHCTTAHFLDGNEMTFKFKVWSKLYRLQTVLVIWTLHPKTRHCGNRMSFSTNDTWRKSIRIGYNSASWRQKKSEDISKHVNVCQWCHLENLDKWTCQSCQDRTRTELQRIGLPNGKERRDGEVERTSQASKWLKYGVVLTQMKFFCNVSKRTEGLWFLGWPVTTQCAATFIFSNGHGWNLQEQLLWSVVYFVEVEISENSFNNFKGPSEPHGTTTMSFFVGRCLTDVVSSCEDFTTQDGKTKCLDWTFRHWNVNLSLQRLGWLWKAPAMRMSLATGDEKHMQWWFGNSGKWRAGWKPPYLFLYLQ